MVNTRSVWKGGKERGSGRCSLKLLPEPEKKCDSVCSFKRRSCAE